MADIAQRGNRLTKGKGQAALGGTRDRPGRHPPVKQRARRAHLFGGGRTNLLEELGRVEGERSNPNRRAEISRVHGELNRGYAKGGVVRRAKKFKTHGKDVPTMAAEGGRIGLKKGGKPWGTGPKPGTHEFLEHHLHKPRKGKAIGSIVKGAKKVVKTIVDKVRKKKRHENLDIPGSPGPEKGKYPGIDKAMSNIKKSGDIWGPGKAKGGRAGYAIGSLVHAATKAAKKYHKKKKLAEDTKKGKFPETESLTHQVGPYVGDVGSERPGIKRRGWGKKPGQKKPDREHVPYERHGAKKGGKADKNWIQKAVNPKHKGYCTPMTKKTCTPARKALARTFKKKAKTGWG